MLNFKKHPFFIMLSIPVILIISSGLYDLHQEPPVCSTPVGTSLIQMTDQKQIGPSGTGKIAVYKPNPHYFQDPKGKPIFLVGPYAFSGSLDLLKGKSNYIRFLVDGTDVPLERKPRNPWPRVPGSGTTSTGIEGKFDLTKFDDGYFAELRQFINDAHKVGIYIHISIFNEIFVKHKPKCCGFGRHPFGNGNHINADLIGNVDRNDDLSGKGSKEFYDVDALWGRTNDPLRLAVAELQKKYVERVLLETRDFPNVFYEIGNEISASHDWFAYWISFIRARASNPISVDDTHNRGFNPLTNKAYPVDAVTYHTGDVVGDFIKRSIPASAYPYNKVLGNDTDGIGRTINRNADQNRKGAWLTFVSGGAIWGDYFDGWTLEKFPDEITFFGNLLHFIHVSQLKYWEMAPCNQLINRGQVLANPGSEYLIYLTVGRTFTIDLREVSVMLYYEWYNPRTGEFIPAATILAGDRRSFTAPDNNDWLLHISSSPIDVRPTPPQTPVNDISG
jgi:hypothetical protein